MKKLSTPFYETTLKKKMVYSGKWLNASEFFQSTVGLTTSGLIAIDNSVYKVMRIDKKRSKYWIAPFPASEGS